MLATTLPGRKSSKLVNGSVPERVSSGGKPLAAGETLKAVCSTSMVFGTLLSATLADELLSTVLKLSRSISTISRFLYAASGRSAAPGLLTPAVMLLVLGGTAVPMGVSPDKLAKIPTMNGISTCWIAPPVSTS